MIRFPYSRFHTRLTALLILPTLQNPNHPSHHILPTSSHPIFKPIRIHLVGIVSTNLPACLSLPTATSSDSTLFDSPPPCLQSGVCPTPTSTSATLSYTTLCLLASWPQSSYNPSLRTRLAPSAIALIYLSDLVTW